MMSSFIVRRVFQQETPGPRRPRRRA
jgi:hypothetical protein